MPRDSLIRLRHACGYMIRMLSLKACHRRIGEELVTKSSGTWGELNGGHPQGQAGDIAGDQVAAGTLSGSYPARGQKGIDSHTIQRRS